MPALGGCFPDYLDRVFLPDHLIDQFRGHLDL
jgi:hypothetical protein